MKKIILITLVVGLLLIFSGYSIAGNLLVEKRFSPETRHNNFEPINDNDMTPPVTTINFIGIQGENDWYKSKVFINLTAIDDSSGVKTIYYRINDGDWVVYVKHFEIFDNGVYVIEFYSVDNAGNTEEVKSADLKIDKWGPFIDVVVERIGLKKWKFIATCFDNLSGMDRVEFYVDDELIFTDYEKPYGWVWNGPEIDNHISIVAWDKAGNSNIPDFTTPYFIAGIILNPQFSEYSVSFFAVIIWDNGEIIKFKDYTLNTIGCIGHIGRFFINAQYRYKWLVD